MAKKANDICVICGRTLLNSKVRAADNDPRIKLNSGDFMCKICEKKIRVMYPVTYKVMKKGYNAFPIDAMRDISVDDYDDLVEKAREYREQMRQNFYWYDAVFQVEHVIKGRGGLFSAPVINAYGHVLYGSFYFSDKVKLLHQGTVRDEVISHIIVNEFEGYPPFFAYKASKIKAEIKDHAAHRWTAEEGYPYRISIQSRNTDLVPGDYIVKGR